MWLVQRSNMACGSLKGVTWHVVCSRVTWHVVCSKE